mgnify:CR=1 FL=1
MKLGIVGLPNVGKSSLFNALTGAGAASENYPFCTIDPNVGVVAVPDRRMDFLANLYHPAKFTPAVVEFVDIAGLVKGASRGEGLGNKFLSHIREVDAILHVVRCFEDDNVTHVDGSINSVRDAETINFELLFADMETVEKRLQRSGKMAKSGDKKYKFECETLEKVKAQLESGVFAAGMDLSEEERAIVSELFLLTDKPMLYAANVSEIWDRVVGQCSGLLAENARQVESIAISAPNRLVILLKQGYTFAKAICERPENATRIRQALVKITGQPVEVEFRVEQPETGAVKAPPRVVTPQQEILKVADHPMVKRAAELFGAEPTHVASPKKST